MPVTAMTCIYCANPAACLETILHIELVALVDEAPTKRHRAKLRGAVQVVPTTHSATVVGSILYGAQPRCARLLLNDRARVAHFLSLPRSMSKEKSESSSCCAVEAREKRPFNQS